MQSDPVGTLKVSGYIRGQALSANGLVHLPGWGDFQLLQIDSATEPFPDTRPKTMNTGKRSIVPMVIVISEISQVMYTFVCPVILCFQMYTCHSEAKYLFSA